MHNVHALGGVLASYALDIGPEVVISDPMDDDTRLIRVLADAPCMIAVDLNPEVTRSGPIPLAAGVPELFGGHKGHRIAVIAR
jgi:hypothetical protein